MRPLPPPRHGSNYTQEKITGILEEVQKFTDVEKLFLYLQLPSSPSNSIEDDAGLVVSSMQAHAFEWIHAHLEECDETALPKRQVYNEYQVHCENRGYRELAASDFGKLMKGVFPNITSRRLGTRGQSLYCYGGLKIKNLVHNPFLPQLDIDEKGNAMTSMKQLISSASPVHTSDIRRLNASQQSRHLLQRRKLQQQQLNKQHYLQQQQAQQKPKALKSDGVTSPHADRGGKPCFIPILPKLFAPGTGGSLQIASPTMLLAGSNHIMPFVGAMGCNRVDLSTISIAKEPSEAAAVADGSSAERSPIRILDTGPKLGVVSLKNGGACRLASDSQNRGHSQTQGKSPSEWHKVVRGKEAMSLGPGAENNRQAQIKCEHGDGSNPQRCSEVADNTADLWGTGNVLLSSSFPDNSEQSTSPENIGLIQEMNKSVGLSSHVNGAIFNDGDVKLGDVMGIVTDTVPNGEQVCCPNLPSQIFPNSLLRVVHTTRTSLPTATTLTTVQANHFGKTSTAVTKNSVTSPESLVHTHVPKSLLMNQPSSFPRSPPKSYRIDSDGKLIMLLDDFYYGQLEGNPQLMKEKVNVGSLPFRCNSCEKVLKTNIRFMNHMQHHMDLERWSTESLDIHTMCKHCFRYFATPYHLQCHVKSAHAIELSAITTRCKICELNYDSEQLLLQHMKDHHKPGEMPYACEVCGFRSSYYTDVDAHFR
uniref:RFX-type winged-helix domain-containing protein n=1 Tax=Eptatretus burgeri TaxID=7764 RepID=A0A8C4QLY9_EPTBU